MTLFLIPPKRSYSNEDDCPQLCSLYNLKQNNLISIIKNINRNLMRILEYVFTNKLIIKDKKSFIISCHTIKVKNL